jgi:hypothetical protein
MVEKEVLEVYSLPVTAGNGVRRFGFRLRCT